MYKAFLIKYAEIGVKGKNRDLFEEALVRQIKYALKRCEGEFRVRRTRGRIYIDVLSDDYDYEETIDNLKTVCGVSAICPMVQLEDEGFDKLCESAVSYMDEHYPDKNITFKVNARRARKNYPVESMEINASVGEKILQAFPEIRVDVHNPDVMLYIEVREHIYIYSIEIPGPGGMPVGTNGKAMLLALNLYGATGDPYYLTAGRRFYDWMDAYLHDPELDIVWNSWLTQPEARLDKAVYSYNTGLLLQGAVALYGYTGDRVYLDNARRLAEGARKFYLPETPDGAAANRDLPWFYLVLLRGYQALYDLDGDPKYVDIFIRWMDWARRNARDAAGLFYNDWSGKKDESATPKWLLDEACIPEYFVRAALIRREVVPAALPR